MKKLVLTLTILLMGLGFVKAESTFDRARNYYNYTNQRSFIFVESGVTFSVYPDGEFDFFINDRVNVGANVNVGRTSISFNSGYNYNPYVQYDDYGAVIQVENVPVYYDFYGRVSQIGDINIWYRNNRVRRIGGLRVFYNNYGYFDYYTGYVNVYNRYITFRPYYYNYFVRPAFGFCQVYTVPYRRYYYPVRYTYYRPYYHNYRRAYATVGTRYDYYDRGHRRSKIYRNDRRVAVRNRGHRNEYGHNRRTTDVVRNSNSRSRNVTRSTVTRTTDGRRSNVSRNTTSRTVSNGKRVAEGRIATQQRQVRKSNANRSQSNRTVSRSTVSRSNKRIASSSGSRTVSRKSAPETRRSSATPVKRTYSNKTKSTRSIAKRPDNRSSRSREVVRNSPAKRSSAKSTNRTSSRSQNRNVAQRSSRKGVR